MAIGPELCTLRNGKTVSRLAVNTFYAGLEMISTAPNGGKTALFQLARHVHQNVPLPEGLVNLLKSVELMTDDGKIFQVGKLVMENALVLDESNPLTLPYAA